VIGLAKTYNIIILALNRTEAHCASDISFLVMRVPIMHSLCQGDEISFQSDGLKEKKNLLNRCVDSKLTPLIV
jgi:hypothetical protein